MRLETSSGTSGMWHTTMQQPHRASWMEMVLGRDARRQAVNTYVGFMIGGLV